MTALGQYPGKPNIVPYTAERPARMRQDPSKATRQYEKCGLGPLPSTPANSSRDALQLDSGGAVLRVSLRPRVANEPRGPPGRANLAPQPCIRLDPWGPDHEATIRFGGKAPGGGHILLTASKPWAITCHRHLGSSSAAYRESATSSRNCVFFGGQVTQAICRSTKTSRTNQRGTL